MDPAAVDAPCPLCLKPAALCVCEEVGAPVDNRVALVVLQHPREQDRALGSARLAVRCLSRASIKVGLSWPSLSKMLGREADPKRWAVLYLGSASAADAAPGAPASARANILAVGRKNEPLADQAGVLRAIEGVIVLDGTWSQAKALWWRNAWMLKCRRIVLDPKAPSRYGALRREPRREGLATIEAAGLVLARLERRPDIAARLDEAFAAMLARFRAVKRAQPELTRR